MKLMIKIATSKMLKIDSSHFFWKKILLGFLIKIGHKMNFLKFMTNQCIDIFRYIT